MSRRNSRTNEHDVAVARYQMIGTAVKTVATVIGAATVVIGVSMYQVNNTVVHAPGGTVTVTSGEVSAVASTLPAPQNP